ncbi:MAG: livG, partial [Rhodoferax sp.]|nr:livG [Rhodoferax sp.]
MSTAMSVESPPVDLLVVSGVSKHFLGLRAVDDVSLRVRQGEIVSLIGPNGAGKTTFFNLLTGQLAPTLGNVHLRGERINDLAPHDRARRGMGRTFQIAKPLIALNALENVMIGAFMRHRALGTARDKAMAVLEKVGLAHHARVRAGDLTLSERRRL